jgi:hypothetical protein
MNPLHAFALVSLSSLATTVCAFGQSPDATLPAAAQSQSAKPEAAKPEAAKPEAAKPAEAGQGAVLTPDLVKRVGGNREIAIKVVDGVYRYEGAMIESPLPDGYPEPTPPGAIDIKQYPTVRRAELTSQDDSGAGMMNGFFPLFNHIKKRDIAMTAPVEMDYQGLYKDFMADEPAQDGATTMSFLYRNPALGPVGDDGKIVVRDTKPMTVLSIGARGASDPTKELESLRAWLKGQTEWEVAGDPRMFVYNGPFIDPNWRWSEMQVPIRRRGSDAAPSTAPAPAAAPTPSQAAPSGPTS